MVDYRMTNELKLQAIPHTPPSDSYTCFIFQQTRQIINSKIKSLWISRWHPQITKPQAQSLMRLLWSHHEGPISYYQDDHEMEVYFHSFTHQCVLF